MHKITLLTFIAIFCAQLVYANPSPINIELNKTRLREIRKMYKITSTKKDNIKGYFDHSINTNKLDIESVLQATVITNKDKIAESVTLILDKNKFQEIYNALSSKYSIIESEIPFVGNKEVVFEQDECYIFLYSPHMSFNMSVQYVTKDFVSKLQQNLNKKKTEKEQQNRKIF